MRINQYIPHNKKRAEARTRKTSKPRSIPISQLSERSYAARDHALHVLAAMRRDPNLSLTHAAKLQGVKRETVRKYFPSALPKAADGRYRITTSDRYVATLFVPGADGTPVSVKTRSSKERAQIGQYLRDLGRYLRGNRDALSEWHGKKIAGVELLTAGRTLKAIEPALSDFSLYRTFNGGAV